MVLPKGAPDADGAGTPQPDSPQTPPSGTDGASPKMEVEGKKVVLESDLVAAKESWDKQSEVAQTAHNSAVDTLRVQLSESQQATAASNARLKELTEKQATDTSSNSDVAAIKAERDQATLRADTADTTVLDVKRRLIVATYQVAPEKVATKTSAELDSFEEALKSVAQSRGGVGPYALGAQGGEPAVPQSNFDRALAIVESTPVLGVRETPAN